MHVEVALAEAARGARSERPPSGSAESHSTLSQTGTAWVCMATGGQGQRWAPLSVPRLQPLGEPHAVSGR